MNTLVQSQMKKKIFFIEVTKESRQKWMFPLISGRNKFISLFKTNWWNYMLTMLRRIKTTGSRMTKRTNEKKMRTLIAQNYGSQRRRKVE